MMLIFLFIPMYSIYSNLYFNKYILFFYRIDRQMIGKKYESIDFVVESIAKVMKKQCDPSQFQLEIKYAKLLSTKDYRFDLYLNQSKSSILILSNKPDTKAYKIRSCATNQEYTRIVENCKKSKLLQKSNTTIMLDLKFGREKFERKAGKGEQGLWLVQYKGNEIKKQINMLIDEKQFRLDLSRKQTITQNGEQILKKNSSKLIADIKCMRFKQETKYCISPYYYVQTREVYQSEDEQQKQNFSKVYKKQSEEEMDKYIVSNIPKNNKKLTFYEIEVKLSEEGVLYLMNNAKKQYQINKFIGDLFITTRNLCRKEFSIVQDKSEMDKLTQQLKVVKV